MGFLDKAKAAASDLAAKADTALNTPGTGAGAGGPKAGDADKYFHDLGVLTYLETVGRPTDPAERERVMGALQQLDQSGEIRSYALHTTPPPAPGAAAQVPPPPGMAGTASAAPPPMPGAAASPAPTAPAAPAEEETSAAPKTQGNPPPPPSWA